MCIGFIINMYYLFCRPDTKLSLELWQLKIISVVTDCLVMLYIIWGTVSVCVCP